MKNHLSKLFPALSKIKAATTALLLLLGCLAVPQTTFAGTYTQLFNFTNTSGPFFGSAPTAGVILSADGTTLYGTASNGGVNGNGVVFSYDIATGAYSKLVDFTNTSGAFPGSAPRARLLLSGNTLYGTTELGGANGFGVIFSYNIGTTVYTDLVDFTGTIGSFLGANPVGGLIHSGTTLYGTTAGGGGVAADGVVFSYNTLGHTYADLVNFTGPSGSFIGSQPVAELLLSGTTLYGTTASGGAIPFGVVFSYNTATTTYTELFNFTGTTGAYLGATPESGLILSGTTLYGTAVSGGATNDGVVFSYNTSTNTYTELFNFTGSTGPFLGANPVGGLILSGTTLYGTASAGGANNFGVIFSYDTATGTYTDLVDFTGMTGNFPGSRPEGALILSGTTLYGTTNTGGATDQGVVFSYNLASGGYAGKKKKKGPRPSHHPRPAPTRTPKYKNK